MKVNTEWSVGKGSWNLQYSRPKVAVKHRFAKWLKYSQSFASALQPTRTSQCLFNIEDVVL